MTAPMTPDTWATTPDTPETPAVQAPPSPEAPPAETPAAPSPSDTLIQALVKGGMPEADAKTLYETATKPPEIKDALEAFLDGKPYPVPKNLMFKLKSGETVVEKSLDRVRQEGMLMQDYQLRRAEADRRARDLDQAIAQSTARQKALEAREQWFQEQQREMIEAQKDPEKWAQYQELQRIAQTNPRVAKMMEDALKQRESAAELEAYQGVEMERAVQSGVQEAQRWIADIAKDPKYAAIDPERVRMLHSRELVATGDQPNGWRNTPQHIRAIFDNELAFVQKATTPLQGEMEELRARIAEIEAQKGVEAHNAKTARVLERAKVPNTAPAGGSPASPVRLVEKKPLIGKQAIEAAVSDWAKQRDE